MLARKHVVDHLYKCNSAVSFLPHASFALILLKSVNFFISTTQARLGARPQTCFFVIFHAFLGRKLEQKKC